MKKIILLLVMFIATYESPLYAHQEYTFSQFGSETLDFFTQPIRWEGVDYLKMGLMFAGTGLTMLADQPIREAVQRDGRSFKEGDFLPAGKKIGDFKGETQKYFYNPAIVFGRMYGDLYSPIAFFAGFAAYSLIFDDLKSRKIAYEIGQASLYTGGLTFLMKFAIGRARPFTEKGTQSYEPFSSVMIDDAHSFPGGHSGAAFVISTVLSRNVEPVWAKVLLYAPAVLTVSARVYQDKHWASDCVFGAAFGYFIATWCVDQHEKPVVPDTKQSLMDRIHVQPYTMGDLYGLNLSFRLM